MNAVWFEDQMFCFTPTKSFIYNPAKNDIVHLDIIVTDTYNSLEDNTLFVLIGTEILKWDHDSGSFMTFEYHSSTSVVSPSSFSAVKVDANSYLDLTFNLYRDNQLIYTTPITSNDVKRLPTKRGRLYSWSLTGTDEVRGVGLATTASELFDGQV